MSLFRLPVRSRHELALLVGLVLTTAILISGYRLQVQGMIAMGIGIICTWQTYQRSPGWIGAALLLGCLTVAAMALHLTIAGVCMMVGGVIAQRVGAWLIDRYMSHPTPLSDIDFEE